MHSAMLFYLALQWIQALLLSQVLPPIRNKCR
jgi:hypothetical protein